MILDRQMGAITTAKRASGTTQRKAAITAGAGLLMMTVAAIFATTVQGDLIIPGDAAATAHNILTNELSFRLSVFSWLVVVVLDLIVAWGLYVYLKPVNRDLSMLAAWLRVAYAAVFWAAIQHLGHALRILYTADSPAIMETGQRQLQAMLALNAFSDGWALGLGLFGIHLMLLGYLVFKAGYLRNVLGTLLLIAGFGYIFDAASGFLFPDFGLTIGQFTFIGELLLALWLVIKGAGNKASEREPQHTS